MCRLVHTAMYVCVCALLKNKYASNAPQPNYILLHTQPSLPHEILVYTNICMYIYS